MLTFYNQDHLGNIREVVNASGAVQQVTNFYPFGAPYADTSAATNPDFQPYKYNGKELDKMHGLNTYDYGARQHDPILARWDRIDPLAEKYYNVSPYAYCHNTPMNKIDNDGRDDYYTSSGQFLFRDNKNSDHIIIRNQLLYELKSMTGAEWIKHDTPIEYMKLSAEAYSKIFTHVLSDMKGEDRIDNLYNNAVSVGTTFCDEVVEDYYNSPILHENANAVTGHINNSVKVSAKVNSGGNEDNRFMFSTISNIQNLLGIHEYKGHGILGWGSAKGNHYDVYMLQMNHPTWNNTTKAFKQTIIDNSKQYYKK